MPQLDPSKCGYRNCHAKPSVLAVLQLNPPDGEFLAGKVYLCRRHLTGLDRKDADNPSHRIVLSTENIR